MDGISSLTSIPSSYGAVSAIESGDGYALAVTKMAMDDTQELAMQEMQKMLPPSPYTFDVRV